MNPEKLYNLISQGENETIEFKASFTKAVIETLVAFSNTRGGRVFVGLSDDGNVKGVSITEETVQKWVNEIKQSTEPAIFPVIDIEMINDKTVVVLSINEFPIKPVAYKDRYFIRKHNSNHKLSVDEITDLRLYSLNYSFDAYEVDTTLDQLDLAALQLFTDKVKVSGRYNLSENIEFDLVKLGIIKSNKLTRAADLLFGLHHTNIHIGRFRYSYC